MIVWRRNPAWYFHQTPGDTVTKHNSRIARLFLKAEVRIPICSSVIFSANPPKMTGVSGQVFLRHVQTALVCFTNCVKASECRRSPDGRRDRSTKSAPKPILPFPSIPLSGRPTWEKRNGTYPILQGQSFRWAAFGIHPAFDGFPLRQLSPANNADRQQERGERREQ